MTNNLMNKNQRFNRCGFAFPAIVDGQNKMVNNKRKANHHEE